MSLLTMNILYEKKGNDWYLWSEARTINAVCYEDNYFPKRNSNYVIVCFTQCTYMFFSTRLLSIANMFALRYLWKN